MVRYFVKNKRSKEHINSKRRSKTHLKVYLKERNRHGRIVYTGITESFKRYQRIFVPTKDYTESGVIRKVGSGQITNLRLLGKSIIRDKNEKTGLRAIKHKEKCLRSVTKVVQFNNFVKI